MAGDFGRMLPSEENDQAGSIVCAEADRFDGAPIVRLAQHHPLGRKVALEPHGKGRIIGARDDRLGADDAFARRQLQPGAATIVGRDGSEFDGCFPGRELRPVAVLSIKIAQGQGHRRAGPGAIAKGVPRAGIDRRGMLRTDQQSNVARPLDHAARRCGPFKIERDRHLFGGTAGCRRERWGSILGGKRGLAARASSQYQCRRDERGSPFRYPAARGVKTSCAARHGTRARARCGDRCKSHRSRRPKADLYPRGC
jgi:hypothetical protein